MFNNMSGSDKAATICIVTLIVCIFSGIMIHTYLDNDLSKEMAKQGYEQIVDKNNGYNTKIWIKVKE